jgi:hypothetical protein
MQGAAPLFPFPLCYQCAARRRPTVPILTSGPGRRGLSKQAGQDGSSILQSIPGRRPRRRPFFWPRCDVRFRSWLASANPEHERPRRRSDRPTTSTTMRARPPVASAARRCKSSGRAAFHSVGGTISGGGRLRAAMSCSGVEWRAAADEAGHYCFAVAL